VSLRERRCAYTAAVVRLLARVLDHPWPYGRVEIAFDEGTIKSPRRVRFQSGTTGFADDAVHKRGSRHYDGLALDLLVYIDGVYLSDGGHPIWRDMDVMAREVDPRLSFGIEFHDSNHLSYDEGLSAGVPSSEEA